LLLPREEQATQNTMASSQHNLPEPPRKKRALPEARRNKSNQEIDVPLFLSSQQVNCGICALEIVKQEVWFLCRECVSTDGKPLPLCRICFQHGRSKDGHPHKSDHSYSVMDSPQRCLLDPSWSVQSELKLLEGVERFGVGNWEAVAKLIVDSKKSPEDCARHFHDVFLANPKVGLVSAKQIKNSKADLAQMRELDVEFREQQALAKRLPGKELPGYMPLRNMFEVEFLDDAEELIAQVSFTKEETQQVLSLPPGGQLPEDVLAKLEMVYSFNSHLDERAYRKSFAAERELLLSKENQRLLRKAPREEQVIRNSLRPLERFSNVVEHNMLVQGLLREDSLRKQLSNLKVHIKDIGVSTTSTSAPEQEERKAAISPADLAMDKSQVVAQSIGLSEVDFEVLKQTIYSHCKLQGLHLDDPHGASSLSIATLGSNFDIAVTALRDTSPLDQDQA